MNEAELCALKDLGALDQARAIELRLENQRTTGGSRPLGNLISRAFSGVHGHAMTHALLAALPVREVVTTNYDTLFESASKGAGKTVSVLPHDPRADAARWVLKMHGCVEDPDDIVLTREDYMRYDHRRQALAGIVQALLLTRHMLFIGFSLRDDNFHRIADAVRRARIPAKKGANKDAAASTKGFGTALPLFSTDVERSLWASDLAWVTMETDPPPGAQSEDSQRRWAAAARKLEIFLDSLLARTGSTSYLLNPRYHGALSERERSLAAKLKQFAEEIERDPLAMAAPAWKHLEALLQRLGWSRTP